MLAPSPSVAALLEALNARHWPAWSLHDGPAVVDGRHVVRLRADWCLRGWAEPPRIVEVRLCEGAPTPTMVEAVWAAGIPAWAAGD